MAFTTEMYMDVIANSSIMDGKKIIYAEERDNAIIFAITNENTSPDNYMWITDNGYALLKCNGEIIRTMYPIKNYPTEKHGVINIMEGEPKVIIDEYPDTGAKIIPE